MLGQVCEFSCKSPIIPARSITVLDGNLKGLKFMALLMADKKKNLLDSHLTLF